jgi:hypothetical protein
MGFWCWLGRHNWETIRSSTYAIDHDADIDERFFASANLSAHFQDTIEQFSGSTRVHKVYNEPEPNKKVLSYYLRISAGYEEHKKVPVFSDRICKFCRVMSLNLTGRVIDALKYHNKYESMAVKEDLKRAVESKSKCQFEKNIKRHPVETY